MLSRKDDVKVHSLDSEQVFHSKCSMIDSIANQRALTGVLFSQAILRSFAIRLTTDMVPICSESFWLRKLECRTCALKKLGSIQLKTCSEFSERTL